MSAPRHGLQAAPAPATPEDAAKVNLEADFIIVAGVLGLRSDFEDPEFVKELEAAQRAREEAEE